MFWERITYYLDGVIPVANGYKIRMACHPPRSRCPSRRLSGVDCVLGIVDGLKKFVAIRESTYHDLNFCQGTVSEMLPNPGTQIFDVIRYSERTTRSSAYTSAAYEAVAIISGSLSRRRAASMSSRPFTSAQLVTT
jgi:D-mannonate dehydratase